MIEKTTEEKIDYIYKVLKNQERRYKLKFYFKLMAFIFLFIYIYYFIEFVLPGYISDFKKSLTPDVSKSISDSIKNIDTKQLIDKFKTLYK